MSKGCLDMSMNFRCLAAVTFLAPSSNVFLHAEPNKTVSYSSLTRVRASMWQGVDGLKNFISPFLLDNRAWFS